MSDTAAIEQLFDALKCAAFQRAGPDFYLPLNPVPLWLEPFVTVAPGSMAFHLARRSRFLEHFLTDAEQFWAAGREGSIDSGPWQESGLGELHLSATALARKGQCFLLIKYDEEAYAERVTLVSKARQTLHAREDQTREMERKEVLIHCIVHDLASPLSGIIGVLDLLPSQPLSEPVRRMVQLASESAGRQQMLIEQILEVFATEATALEKLVLAPGAAPDLRAVAEAALRQASLSFEQHEVAAALIPAPHTPVPCPVMAETTRLERIFANLLENALRHSPAGTHVEVHLACEGGTVEVRVEDAGPGAPPEAIPHLFKKLAPSAGGVRGKAGLGLYFCRITVERWGGEIGYRQSPRGGACFWFKLHLAEH